MLQPPEFHVLQRKRLWHAMRCLILLERNATFLGTAGQKAALSYDLDVAQRGARLAIGSLQLKVNLLAAEGAVLVKWLFPTSPLLVRVTNLTGSAERSTSGLVPRVKYNAGAMAALTSGASAGHVKR
jgi:hypothetical protein